MMLEEIPKSPVVIYCPLCPKTEMGFSFSSKFNRHGYKNYAYSLYKCHQCDLVMIYPPGVNTVYLPFQNNLQTRLGSEDFPWNKKLIQQVLKYKTSGEFLDLGCNAGFLVNLANQNGFNAIGVEIDEQIAKQAAILGNNVIQGDFLEMNFSKKFDVIIMNHVLEHIPEFSKVANKLSGLLADDGVIFINVPNYYSLISWLMKENWSTLAPYTHIWMFSSQSIHNLFKNYFKTVVIKTNTATEPHGHCLDLKTILKTLIIKAANLLDMGDETQIILFKK